MDRRRFVKVCVGVAGAGALGAAGFATLRPLAQTPGATGLVRYYGALRTGGPAPRGVPYVPILVRDGVFVVRSAPFRHAGIDHDPLAWHRYCLPVGTSGLDRESGQDDTLRYWMPPERLKVLRPWYADKLGEPIRPEDFPDVGFGATFTWRSEGMPEERRLVGVLVRASSFEHVRDPVGSAKALDVAELAMLRERVFHEDFVAVNAACTHFCCKAGYKEAEKLARPRGAWEQVFCACHDSAFDLQRPVAYLYAPHEPIPQPAGV